MKNKKINDAVVIIPALNESATIAEIVTRAKSLGFEVLVVDDASADGTAGAAEAAGAKVLRLEKSKGNLRAILAGFQWALDAGYAWLATMDADGQHSPDDLPALLKIARKKADSLVIGSCPERSSWMRIPR